jgi:hypothetical protein
MLGSKSWERFSVNGNNFYLKKGPQDFTVHVILVIAPLEARESLCRRDPVHALAKPEAVAFIFYDYVRLINASKIFRLREQPSRNSSILIPFREASHTM